MNMTDYDQLYDKNHPSDDSLSETPLMRERLLRKLWFNVQINVKFDLFSLVDKGSK